MLGMARLTAWILVAVATALTAVGVPMLFWKDMVPLSEFDWRWLVYVDLGGNLLFSLPLLGFVLVAEARVVGGGPFRRRWWGGAILIVLFLLEVGFRQETYAGPKYEWVPELLYWARIAAVWPIWYFATQRAQQRRELLTSEG